MTDHTPLPAETTAAYAGEPGLTAYSTARVWPYVGAEAFLVNHHGTRPHIARVGRVTSLSKTRITVLYSTGTVDQVEQYRRSDLKRIGVGNYHSETLHSADSPTVAQVRLVRDTRAAVGDLISTLSEFAAHNRLESGDLEATIGYVDQLAGVVEATLTRLGQVRPR